MVRQGFVGHTRDGRPLLFLLSVPFQCGVIRSPQPNRTSDGEEVLTNRRVVVDVGHLKSYEKPVKVLE